jgi:3-hydroxyacyl-[acyl-carrier-protein] dehydratase
LASDLIENSQNTRYKKPNRTPVLPEDFMRFFLIDRITVWEVGTAAEAIKNIALSEDFFDDHFPRRPVMPGVLMIEGMAQLAGLLLEASLKDKHGRDAKAILTVLERTKFREMVRPGDTLLYRAEVMSISPEGGKAAVRASREGRPVIDTALVFAFKYLDDPLLERRRAELMKTWRNSP